MDRIKKLKNESQRAVHVAHSNGLISSVPSGGTLENVQIVNLSELRGYVTVTMDLGEVNENQGRQQLHS